MDGFQPQQQQPQGAPGASEPEAPLPQTQPAQRESKARLRFQLPVLARLQAEADAEHARRGKSKRSRRANQIAGWTTGGASQKPVLAPVREEGADSNAQLCDKLGRDRRRRFLNDILLRELCPSGLTAADMESLFSPVPFGAAHPSAFASLARSDAAPLWDLFRSVDEDAQNKQLQAWQQRLRQQRQDARGGDGEPRASGGCTALRAWARVPRRQREALKRCDAGAVEALELPICEFLDREQETGAELELEPGPEAGAAHQRLLCHGLAAFHGLRCGGTLAGGLRLTRVAGTPAGGCPPITAADVVFALEANPAAGLTPAQLDAQWRRQHYGTDADSCASFMLV